MLDTIHQLVVQLIRDNDQIMLLGHSGDLQQHRA